MLVAALTTPLAAEQRFLELDPTATTRDVANIVIRPCDILHELYPVYCQYWHVVAVEARPGTTTVLHLETESEKASFSVDWTGPNYLLETGEMVAPVGSDGKAAVGATWVEVWPQAGRSRLVTGWDDRNSDGQVGALDAITLDGAFEITIRDIRTILSISRLNK